MYSNLHRFDVPFEHVLNSYLTRLITCYFALISKVGWRAI